MPIISEETVKLLNNHLNEEHYSANLYFNMAGWCSKQGLKGCASFLNNHSAEEHTHLEKLNEFIKKVDGQPIMGAMKEPEHSFSSAEEVFEKIKQFIRNKIKMQIKFIFTKEIFIQVIIYKKLKFIKCLD